MYQPLFFEFDYKVINNATGQIVRSFWENASSSDWKPTIVCAKRNNSFRSKWDLCEIEDNYRLTRYLQGLRHVGLADVVNQPDMIYQIWGRRVLGKINNLIKKGQFDYIQSLSCPYGDHLVAMEIKKKTGLPWIAQFFDPWIEHTASFMTNYFRKRFEHMEYEIAKNADFILHTNDKIVEVWISRYGSLVSNKIKALPLTFNTTNLPLITPHGNNEKMIISHIGHIYESRTLKDVVDAVKTLAIDNPNLLSKLEFVIVGRINNGDEKYIKDNKLDKVFRFVGVLPPDQLEEYYQKSDAFIALDLNTTNCLSYPSKLMQYYYYRKPIIGITVPNSVMEADLIKSKHKVFYYGDSAGIKDFLLQMIMNKGSDLEYDVDYWKNFEIGKGIDEYKKVVNHIISDKQK